MPDTDRPAIAAALETLSDWAATVTWEDLPETVRARP